MRRCRFVVAAAVLTVAIAACTGGAGAARTAPTPRAHPAPVHPTPVHPTPVHPTAVHPTAVHPTSRVPSRPATIHGIGDSIMVDATPNLRARLPGITIDAVVGRRVGPGLRLLRAEHRAGTVATTTVFGLGTNGPFTRPELLAAIGLTAGHTLIVITAHCPHCAWIDTNNAMIASVCIAARHCRIADFQAQALRHPRWFERDGVHLPVGGPGADAYARTVAAISPTD